MIPATSWPGHLRVHQYSGSVTQTFGGLSLDLDQDYLDVQLMGSGGTGGTGGGGGTAQASQAVADQSSGVVNMFFRGSDGALWHDWFTPSAGWHGPASFGGSLASEPSVVSSVPQSVAVFYRGTDGNLWSAAYSPGTGWSALQNLGMGPLGSGPVAVAQAAGVIDVFWRGTGSGQLWHAGYTPGSGWNGPQDLGGSLASGPSPAVSGGAVVSVFWRGTDGHLWQTLRSPGASWLPPASLGMGQLGGAPVAAGEVNGTIDVFWNGIGGSSLWHAGDTVGLGWSGPSLLTTTGLASGVGSAPFAVASSAGSMNVFWKGATGGLWWAWPGSTWQTPVPLPMGTLGGGPFAAGQGNGMIDVFWHGSADSNLWHARYSGSWACPGGLGGAAS